jgi:hypothetical protein
MTAKNQRPEPSLREQQPHPHAKSQPTDSLTGGELAMGEGGGGSRSFGSRSFRDEESVLRIVIVLLVTGQDDWGVESQLRAR